MPQGDRRDADHDSLRVADIRLGCDAPTAARALSQALREDQWESAWFDLSNHCSVRATQGGKGLYLWAYFKKRPSGLFGRMLGDRRCTMRLEIKGPGGGKNEVAAFVDRALADLKR